MPGSTLLKERAAARMDRAIGQGGGALKQIAKDHLKAQARIQSALGSFFAGSAPEEDFGARLQSPRGETLMNVLTAQAGFLTGRQARAVKAGLQEAARETYGRSMFDLQKDTGLAFPLRPLEEKELQKIVAAPLSGRTFESRISRNGKLLDKALREDVGEAIRAGKSLAQVKETVQERLGMSYRAAQRLMNTETCRVANASQLKSYEEAGISRYEFVAVLDKSTSKACQDLDGQVFEVKDARPGKNLPPLHPHCRSTTAPALVEREREALQKRAVDPETGEAVRLPGDMGYEEWKKWQEAGSPADIAAWRGAGQTQEETRRDQIQYEYFRKRLGDKAPATFEEFSRMKLSSGEEWEKLQEDFRYEGIIGRLKADYPGLQIFEEPKDIPQAYKEDEANLPPREKNGPPHYSHYPEGIRMNKALGKAAGVVLDEMEQGYLDATVDALNRMKMPEDTVVWRGSAKFLLKGLEELEGKPMAEWVDEKFSMDGFASTSILQKGAYANKEVNMVILAPKGKHGAGYINEISYNKAHVGETEDAHVLKEEFEVLLQRGSKYRIIEAQKLGKDRLILVVRWEGQ